MREPDRTARHGSAPHATRRAPRPDQTTPPRTTPHGTPDQLPGQRCVSPGAASRSSPMPMPGVAFWPPLPLDPNPSLRPLLGPLVDVSPESREGCRQTRQSTRCLATPPRLLRRLTHILRPSRSGRSASHVTRRLPTVPLAPVLPVQLERSRGCHEGDSVDGTSVRRAAALRASWSYRRQPMAVDGGADDVASDPVQERRAVPRRLPAKPLSGSHHTEKSYSCTST